MVDTPYYRRGTPVAASSAPADYELAFVRRVAAMAIESFAGSVLILPIIQDEIKDLICELAAGVVDELRSTDT